MTGRASAETRIVRAAALVAALTIAVGLGVRPFGHTMGTALSPFVMAWLPRATVWLLPALVVLAVVVAFAPRLPPVLLALAAGLALNVIPLGPGGLDVVFDGSFEAKNEYLPGLGALSYGWHVYLDRFAELVPSFPINVGGHPPGPLLAMDLFGITTPARLAAVCIAAVVVNAPLTTRLATTLGIAADRARLAGVLAALSPSLLLFGMTSLDAVFAALGTGTAVLLIAPRARWLGVVVFAAITFTAWSLLAIGFFAAVVVWQREGLRRALVLAAACGVAVLLLNGVLALTTGYDALGTLQATHTYYGKSLARIRPYAFWWIGSPVAWAVMLGPVTAAAWLVAAKRRNAAAVALLAVIVIAAVAGFTKAEVERIWLPFVPFACVAAATVLPVARTRVIAVALVAQGLAVSLLFQTIW